CWSVVQDCPDGELSGQVSPGQWGSRASAVFALCFVCSTDLHSVKVSADESTTVCVCVRVCVCVCLCVCARALQSCCSGDSCSLLLKYLLDCWPFTGE